MNDFLNRAKGEVSDRVDEVTRRANEAKEAILEKAGDVKDATMKKVEEGREYVQKNPEKSAGIALGAGALLGAIVGFFTGRKR